MITEEMQKSTIKAIKEAAATAGIEERAMQAKREEKPKEEINPNELVAQIKEEMENVYALDVPLKVEIDTGINWYEAK